MKKNSIHIFILFTFLLQQPLVHANSTSVGGGQVGGANARGIPTKEVNFEALSDSLKSSIQEMDIKNPEISLEPTPENPENEIEIFLDHKTQYNEETGKAEIVHKGLNEEGLKKFQEQRTLIHARYRQFGKLFLNMESIHHTLMISGIGDLFNFLYGPPGGAKTGVLMWFYNAVVDMKELFLIQLHQMTSASDLIGGLNIEKAKTGVMEYNHEGTLVESKKFILDEVDKGNPSTLGVLLQLLDDLRVLKIGRYSLKSLIKTGAMTSNSTLHEILEAFKLGGQGSTGPALLNRLHFKYFLYNWLTKEDQLKLNELYDFRRDVELLPKAKQKEAWSMFLETDKTNISLDWDTLKKLALGLFKLNTNAQIALTDIVNTFREQTGEAIKESETNQKTDPNENPHVLEPSFNPTERLRDEVTNTIIISAFIDFMNSDLSSPENMDALNEKIKKGGKFELGPLSLWRAASILTTTTSGKKTALVIENDGTVKVEFSNFLSHMKGRTMNNSESALMEQNIQEQLRFKGIYETMIRQYQKTIKEVAQLSPLSNNIEAETRQDLEFLLND